jgi:hypothetical protein
MASSQQVQPGFDRLDRSFGRVLIEGYLAGFVIVFGLVVALLIVVGRGVPLVAAAFAALAVATFAGGMLGAVLALGPWAARHEREINR